MSAIFISYRREDTLSATGRLADALTRAFGADEVFRDLQAIQAGSDFRVSLADALRMARVVIVVIGPSWLRPTGAGGRPRLYDIKDYVRFEVETALSEDLPIIPVLVEGARMPQSADLPESVAALGYRQAHEVSERRWDYDVDSLIDVVAQHADLLPHARLSKHRTLLAASSSGMVREAVRSLPSDFFKLLYMPRRFLASRGTDSQQDLIRALVFLTVLQPIGAAIVLLEWPTRSGLLPFLATPIVITLLGAVGLSLPLYLAWRIVGARGRYRRVLTILLYQCSLMGLIQSVITMITLGGANAGNPRAVAGLAANLTIEGLLQFLADFESAAHGAPSAIIAMVNTLILLAVLVWLAMSWGAYRDALRLSRARSAAALAMFLMFCAVPVAVLAWVASFFLA